MRHVRIGEVEWQKPVVTCSPAAKARPGNRIKRALQMALTVSMLHTNEAIPGVVCGTHSQESFTKFVYKVIPERCVPGLRIPMVEDLLNVEPCSRWAAFAQELPFDDAPPTMDMKFAAKWAVQHRGRARGFRSQYSTS